MFPRSATLVEGTTATGTSFLEQVGLQGLEEVVGDDDLKITAAEYLPDDILAAPSTQRPDSLLQQRQ